MTYKGLNYKLMDAENLIYEESEMRKWREEIPYIDLPQDIQFRPIPNHGGSIVRFTAMKDNRSVSVYLDCYGRLGACDEPYWEVHPSKDGYPDRCMMEDVEGLVKIITEAL
jgi:hypothetical protein